MKQRNVFKLLLVVAIPLIIFAGLIVFNQTETVVEEIVVEEVEVPYDLPVILERGVLKATTDYNSTNYFVYRGQPMGFHLEMLKLFTQHIGVDLELFVSNDLQENFACLMAQDECDLIAMDLTVTRQRRNLLDFTEPHSQTRQVLIQRRPEDWYSMRSTEIEDQLVRSQLDLARKTIHVQKNTSFMVRLNNLMDEIGDTIYIVEVEEETEQLIERVANGEIEYTVSDEHVAMVNQTYYPNIDIQTPLSFSQNLSWAVRHDTPLLKEAIDEWMRKFKQTRQYANLYAKYFKNPRSSYMARSDYHSQGGGKISVFDDHFKRFAEIIGWDWRLIASLAFQESRFRTDAVSWAGAFGIMQLMPNTASMYNVNYNSSPVDNIVAGIKYLRWIEDRMVKIIDDDQERIKFVLASYNVGIGHVLDARRLAEKYGKNPNVWKDNVDYYVLNKSKPKYYLDPLVKHGYARGSEPYHYVTEILERFEHYKNIVDEG
ncbi:MAG: transglycosylase SLT domain-containing protein [Bacteroidota bacterium]